MQKTAAVVVTYNRRDLLARCLASLRAQRGARCDIWVIDNAGTDGTPALLAELAGPDLFVHRTKENLGGAGGFWLGAKLAVEAGYETLWLMDDDTLPEPDALAALLKADAALPENGWLSSRALTQAGADQPMNRQRKTPYRDIDGYEGTVIPAVMASFVSLFVRAEIVREFGLPYREFFIWADDWEYTRRISRCRPCYVVPASRAVHAMQNGAVVNIARDAEARLPRYRYAYRNDVVLYRREGLRGWLWLLLKDLWHSAQVVLGPCTRKGLRLRTIWKSAWAGLRFAPAVEYPGKAEGQNRG